MLNELAGDARTHRAKSSEVAAQAVELAGAMQGMGRNVLPHSQVVQVPAQPVLQASAFCHEVVTVVEQKSQIFFCLSGASRGQARLSAGCFRYSPGIDRIGLPVAAGAAPRKTHELGRDPEYRLPF